ncbi:MULTISPECIES: galactokinase family protein [unclassified Breznakia]|uniref:galactokinase n=1 Tax=unclassified Breznakia TaxID=2623764 RepID=UPI00247620E3|nr:MULTISPECIES: galactokinase family protein [unclassified Breznakia]MDH6366952.1 galactokinase [Breznakia sp. PH1-1]MDH6404130.1 galactokinase [Breznakia sp. PF1-11]MDH6411839.1 galactokinase [Breznakia sp. PFB1-11]MDH6414118.1 galactokinase [Breznakia sp. PFB1-14]MDH6416525.1 galactokinase [Breznakia sp. PFB1-4]
MANIQTLIEEMKTGKHDADLLELYVDESVIERQKARYVLALETFKDHFGDKEVRVYSAPGRSEVGGNHTDHQRGRVLAAGVNLDTIAVVAKRDDDVIVVDSEGFNIKPVNAAILDINEKEAGTSEAIIRGVAAGIKNKGGIIGGFEAYMTSDVLEGAGLSSSAAFETLLGTILSHEYNEGSISAVDIAKIGQYAENEYFMKPCGLMDQMASSVGSFITIDFKDPKNPIVEKVDFDFDSSNHSLCIVDTKGSHADLTDEYAAVPADMKKVANYFGKDVLREVDSNEFYANVGDIRNAIGDRPVLRAYHFFGDNDRVVDEVAALKANDFETFKNLVKASGDSSFKYLQNVYSNKNINEQNISTGLAMSEYILQGKGVCRVHGGGFAGTIQAFVPNEMLTTYKQGIEAVFGEGSCYVLKVRPFGGHKVFA